MASEAKHFRSTLPSHLDESRGAAIEAQQVHRLVGLRLLHLPLGLVARLVHQAALLHALDHRALLICGAQAMSERGVPLSAVRGARQGACWPPLRGDPTGRCRRAAHGRRIIPLP